MHWKTSEHYEYSVCLNGYKWCKYYNMNILLLANLFVIWINLNPFHRRILCAKFGWNWQCSSVKEDFKILSMYFHLFVIISPWKRVRPFIWKTLFGFIGQVISEKKMKMWKVYRHADWQTAEDRWSEFLSPKDALLQVWLKSALSFWRKFFISNQCLITISFYLLLDISGKPLTRLHQGIRQFWKTTYTTASRH